MTDIHMISCMIYGWCIAKAGIWHFLIISTSRSVFLFGCHKRDFYFYRTENARTWAPIFHLHQFTVFTSCLVKKESNRHMKKYYRIYLSIISSRKATTSTLYQILLTFRKYAFKQVFEYVIIISTNLENFGESCGDILWRVYL